MNGGTKKKTKQNKTKTYRHKTTTGKKEQMIKTSTTHVLFQL